MQKDHEESAHTDQNDHNCLECDHQTNSKYNLNKHMDIAHGYVNDTNIKYKCVSCAQGFAAKSSLINHRRDAHGKSKIKCIFKEGNQCRNGANNGEKCLYDHSDSGPRPGDDKYDCNVCDLQFKYKSQLIKHRKDKHPETVQLCKTIKEGTTCSFVSHCGFSHEADKSKDNYHEGLVSTEDKSTPEIFWQGPNKIRPSDQLAVLTHMMKTMMEDIVLLKQQAGKKM